MNDARPRPIGSWDTVILLALVVLSTVWSVQGAQWVDRAPSLTAVALLGLGAGLLLAKCRLLPAVLAHVTGFYLGLLVVVWQTTTVMGGTSTAQKAADLTLRLNTWFYAARSGGINADTLVFAFLLAALTWIVAYLAAALLFRGGHVWLGIAPSAIALFANLSYAPPRLAVWLVFYLIAAMLLVMRVYFLNQEQRWLARRVAFAPTFGWTVLRDTAVFAILVVALAWVAPTANASPDMVDRWQRLVKPWDDLRGDFARLFAGLTSQNESLLLTFGRSLPLKGSLTLSNAVAFTVRASERQYWRAIVYDRYTREGFFAGDGDDNRTYDMPADGLQTPPYLQRRPFVQEFELAIARTDVVLAAGYPLQLEMPATVEAQTIQLPPVTIAAGRPAAESPSALGKVPAVLDSLNARLDRRQLPGERVFQTTVEEVGRVLPPGYAVTQVNLRGLRPGQVDRVDEVRLARTVPDTVDVIALRTTTPLRRGTTYRVISLVSTATVGQLRAASAFYPEWVRSRYLQLPEDFSPGVRQLAQSLAAGKGTPYDKAIAIEAYLRTLTYNTKISAPPPGQDGVEYFLFTSRQGYCDYFATAMAVMLRAVGVSARVVSGYQPGEIDPESGRFVVREANAHSWVEVFFREYGWIQFEPTPSQPTIDRPRDPSAPPPALPLEPEPPEPRDRPAPGQFARPPAVETPRGWLGLPAVAIPSLLVAIVAIGMIATGLGWAAWQQGLRGLGPAAGMYTRLQRLASLTGLGQSASQTPFEYAAWLKQRVRYGAEAIDRIVAAYVGAVFGRRQVGEAESSDLSRAWVEARKAVLRQWIERLLKHR